MGYGAQAAAPWDVEGREGGARGNGYEDEPPLSDVPVWGCEL